MLDMLDGVIAEVSRDERSEDEYAAEARARRLAARAARNAAAAHHCSERCTHRNHRRDVRHALLMIEALELQGVPPPTDADYDDKVTYHSMTRSQAARMR